MRNVPKCSSCLDWFRFFCSSFSFIKVILRILNRSYVTDAGGVLVVCEINLLPRLLLCKVFAWGINTNIQTFSQTTILLSHRVNE